MTGAFPIAAALTRVRAAAAHFETPVVTEVAGLEGDPFKVLMATLISLRTQDEVTGPAAARLFAVAPTPQAMLALPEAEIARRIYPAGFFRVKARTLQAVCERLMRDFGGAVPADLDTLLTLPGVGRKTANLVLTEGFHLPAICVDVHVHRILNRWGYLRTHTPERTELRLRAKLPGEWWIPINPLLVAFGRNVCRPVSPHCSRCPAGDLCRRVGVTTHR